MAQMGTLHEAFVEELRDTYDAEKQLTKALPKMAKAASSPELKDAFETHLEETRQQIERLIEETAILSAELRAERTARERLADEALRRPPAERKGA